MPSLSVTDVADAMQREIGLRSSDGKLQVDWVLRRVVCEAA
jgi:hypothetical protein